MAKKKIKSNNSKKHKKSNNKKNTKVHPFFQFYNNHKKLIKYISIAIIILVILLIATYFYIKINFITQSELHISLSPIHNIITTSYNDKVSLNFSIQNSNFWFCNSECNFQLYDPYTQKIITQENQTLRSNSNINKEYKIALNTRGQGQRLYYFFVSCKNLQSLSCKTPEKIYTRSSLVTINYHEPEEELKIRDIIQSKLDNFSKDISKLNPIINNIIELNNILKNKTNISTQNHIDNYTNQLNKIINFNQKINKLWNESYYYEIDEFLTQNMIDNTHSLINESNKTLYKLIDTKNIYNEIAKNLIELNSQINTLSKAHSYQLIINNQSKLQEIINLNTSLNSFVNNLKNKQNLSNVDLSNSQILKNQTSLLVNQYLKNKNNLINHVQNNLVNYKKINEFYINKYPIEKINNTNNFSSTLKELLNNFNKINNISLTNRLLYQINYNDFNNINSYLINNITKQQNLTFNNTGFYLDKDLIYNNSNNLNLEQYYNITLIPKIILSKINNTINYIASENKNNILFINSTIKKINFTITRNISIKKHQVPKPECCIFEECSACESKTQKYPLILIHGHSMNEENPVESSLTSMYYLQQELSNQQLYINAADITIDSLKSTKTWSNMTYPISIRASYYLILNYNFDFYTNIIRKDENIETYSIRLKEIVDFVSEKTNSKKVNIIAHSMGGLVARKYIQLFGEEKIENLIMIGTPNHGVEGKVNDFCSTLGAKRECEDMSKNSIFLKILNSYIPKNKTQFSLIYGVGCNTNNKEGDGIVTKDSAKLEYATNYEINSSCKSLGELHSDLLNPKKNPKVIEIIKNILIN